MLKTKVKNLHVPEVNEDTKQHFQAIFSLLLESSKVLMATLLVVFVPQRCSENADGICTFMDNFEELTNYNKFVLAFNFLSLGIFICLYKIEYKREKWCIQYLDIDPNKPNTNLKIELQYTSYESIQKDMKLLNSKYWRISLWTVILYTLNVLFSSILIYSDYYLDYRTITVMLTNIILVGDKLYNCFTISKKSVNEEMACSAYLKTAIIFNVIDSDYHIPIPTILEVPAENIPVQGEDIEMQDISAGYQSTVEDNSEKNE